MNFGKLSQVIKGIDDLTELEKTHPVIGSDLGKFLSELQRACDIAYEHFLQNVEPITRLDVLPSGAELQAIRGNLGETYSHRWFKDVGRVCAVLDGLVHDYGEKLTTGMNEAAGKISEEARGNLWLLINDIHSGEQGFERDIQQDAKELETALDTAIAAGRVEPLRHLAIEKRQMLSAQLKELRRAVTRTLATSGKATDLLKSQIVEKELATSPFSVMLFGGFFMMVLLAGLAAVARLFPPYYFILITGAMFTGTVLLNAFHLLQIGALSQENFLELIKLALLKFFAPLTHRFRRGTETPASH